MTSKNQTDSDDHDSTKDFKENSTGYDTDIDESLSEDANNAIEDSASGNSIASSSGRVFHGRFVSDASGKLIPAIKLKKSSKISDKAIALKKRNQSFTENLKSFIVRKFGFATNSVAKSSSVFEPTYRVFLQTSHENSIPIYFVERIGDYNLDLNLTYRVVECSTSTGSNSMLKLVVSTASTDANPTYKLVESPEHSKRQDNPTYRLVPCAAAYSPYSSIASSDADIASVSNLDASGLSSSVLATPSPAKISSAETTPESYSVADEPCFTDDHDVESPNFYRKLCDSHVPSPYFNKHYLENRESLSKVLRSASESSCDKDPLCVNFSKIKLLNSSSDKDDGNEDKVDQL